MEPMPDLTTVQLQRGTNPYTNRVSQRQVALRLKLGDKQAKELSELKGNIPVQALSVAPEALISVPEVEKAAGKKADGKSGGFIEVSTFEKQANGTYRVKYRYQSPPMMIPANTPMVMPAQGAVQFQVQGGGAVQAQPGVATSSGVPSNVRGLPVLGDADGKELTLEQMPKRLGKSVNGQAV